jgi:ribonuclease G
MANELIINASLPETRIALMEDGEIQELLIERASGKGIVGNIYKGRVTRVLPGMQAAFVDIGLEKAAFLYVDDVYVHSEIWEEEEGPSASALSDVHRVEAEREVETVISPVVSASESVETPLVQKDAKHVSEAPSQEQIAEEEDSIQEEWSSEELDDDDDDSDDEPQTPVEMSADPSDGEGKDGPSDQPPGTLAPESQSTSEGSSASHSPDASDQKEGDASESSTQADSAEEGDAQGQGPGRKRHRRGRRGGRFRRRTPATENAPQVQAQQNYPENYHEQVADSGNLDSDRSGLGVETPQPLANNAVDESEPNRPEQTQAQREIIAERRPVVQVNDRSEFKAQRSRDRRIRQKTSSRPVKSQVNIQDLLKEGQEVLVQVAKDPIATKGARLTCHISLPGRHLVCMPTIDHVGVSRRIEREDERRRLREYVERNRPRNLGFIVRTASGKQQSEKRIKQDIEYLTRLWTEIKEKTANVTAPALVYEDLNAVLRAIRDWVTEEIDKVVVDSRYHYNEIQRFVSHFMPPLKQKVELYHGDIPIFDAYGISTELSRALERKVWLKSGGYIVIDQAEALVAIDVNTGRYVGKKNLEDTILKTNLEAVQEIAYQLRLRNCGGIIILDLIDMEKDENKQRVYRALEEALLRDRARPTILKISELGLVEMTRKRTRDTIVRSLCESCTHCEGKGFIKSKQTVAYEVMREVEREGIERDVNKILVQAHPDVIDILAIDERETLDQLERRYRKLIYLQAVTDFHPEQFEVTADKRDKSERSKEHHTSERSHDSHHHSDRSRHRGDRHRHEGPHAPHVSVNEGGPTAVIKPVVITPVVVPVTQPEPASVGSTENSTESGSALILTPAPTPLPGNAAGPSNQDGFYDEEDRLAFLRAQAAQDAALARLGNGGGHATPRTPSEGSNRGGMNGRRGARGGRRGSGGGAGGGGGGKFRRGNDRNRDRGSKQFGYNQGPTPKWGNDQPQEGPIKPVDSSGTGGSSGGGNNGEGPTGNGGGDHSQPPV